MKFKILMVLVSLIFSVPTLANKTRGTGEKDMGRLETNVAVQKALKEVNEVLKQNSLGEIEVKDVVMKVESASLFKESLESFKTDLSDPTKMDQVQKIKNEGIISSINKILQSQVKIEEAAKDLPAARPLVELPANAINIARAGLDTTTNKGLIGQSMSSIARFSEGQVTEASIKKLIEELNKQGLKLEDIIKCR